MSRIAIIPARSGSKGLKDKNIKDLCGKPMLAYTIEAAKESGLFQEIMVSTDSREYAEIAEAYGARIPFLREAELAGDHVGSWQVVKAILNRYRQEKQQSFEMLALLQPTSPLRKAEHLKAAFALFENPQTQMVVSVCEAEHSPLWMNTLSADRSMEGFIDFQKISAYRQGLPIFYRINGAIYLAKTKFILEEENYYNKGCYAYLMSKEDSVDIDDALDFQLAELRMKNSKA